MVAYERKSSRQGWKAGHMAAAISAIKNGKHTYRQCKELFGIPRSTLERRVNNKNKFAVGAKKMMGNMVSVLPKVVEYLIYDYILNMEDMSAKDVRKLAYDMAEKKEIVNPFKGGLAGRSWFYAFCRRYPRLSIRTPENTSKSCVPETMIHGFPSNTYIFEGQNSAAAVTNVKSLCSEASPPQDTSSSNQETLAFSVNHTDTCTSEANQETASPSGTNQEAPTSNASQEASTSGANQRLTHENKVLRKSVLELKQLLKANKRKSSLKVDSDAHAINIEILENGQFHIVRYADGSLNFYKYYVGYIIDVDHSKPVKEQITTKFMVRCDFNKTKFKKFKYPKLDDLAEHPVGDIMVLLPKPIKVEMGKSARVKSQWKFEDNRLANFSPILWIIFYNRTIINESDQENYDYWSSYHPRLCLVQ